MSFSESARLHGVSKHRASSESIQKAFFFAVEIGFPAAVLFGNADSAKDRNGYCPHLSCHVLLTL